VVLNGTELGSGSIRIHRQDIQHKIFRALGMTEEEAKSRFGFFLEALEYGTPPHGGIALGLDRIVMILAGAESLREVIPFPKTARAVDLMVDAPTPVGERQLKELGLTTQMEHADFRCAKCNTAWKVTSFQRSMQADHLRKVDVGPCECGQERRVQGFMSDSVFVLKNDTAK
jgi:hypothetical protein